MVTIKRIRIKNFRSLVDETLELSNFNFFVGKNDSGKSNVLKALNLFFNNMTDFNTPFDFVSDYSKFAKRGSKQAKEITISVDISMPESFKEKGIKTWTKVWRSEGLHSDNLKELFKGGSRGITLFGRIRYMYIPAVKSNEYFKFLLSEVYSSMTQTANSELRDLNNQYSRQLQNLTRALSEQLKNVLNLNSAIQMPQKLNVLFRDLIFLTSDDHVEGVDLNHRGDGIKARHIPSILRYMQKNIEENRPKKAIISSFIWGFEEPENGVEYLSCFEMADELYSYREDCQMLITTHSPAFYMKRECEDANCFYVYKGEEGESKYKKGLAVEEIDERMGFLPLVAPYIMKERQKYLEREKILSTELAQLTKKYNEETGRIIIITEGKTDTKHIKIAFEQLELDSAILERIEYYDFAGKNVLGEALYDLLIKMSNMHNVNRIIGIFDRDKHMHSPATGKKYIKLKNNVYMFNIPAIENSERKKNDKICIEHYYSNREIEMDTDYGHLYMGKDFNEFGQSMDGHWVFQDFAKNRSMTELSIVDSSNKHLQRMDNAARIISKDDFADYVVNHPEKFDFKNFKQIYDVISNIIVDTE